MALAPLTHHQILQLAEPFARLGYHVDLPASDRVARKLAFKPVDVPQAEPNDQPLRLTLHLDCQDEHHFVVERRLLHPGGLQASLQTQGSQPAALLSAVENIQPAHQFVAGPGFVIARSYDLWADGSLFMARAQLRVQGLSLTMMLPLPSLRTVAGNITLTPDPGTRFDLPEDLLAVQGWDWTRLERNKAGWISKLRLRGNALRRSRTAESAPEQMAQHLVKSFGQSPAQFHDSHPFARWGVVFRRGIPTLIVVLMIASALLMVFLVDRTQVNTGPWMALHYLPIALLAFGFSLQELPRFEIPPLPRRSRAAGWYEVLEPAEASAA
jgi:hypothetical protein